MSAFSDGTLIVAEAVILRDIAYRERVRKHISAFARIGPVRLLIFGVGKSEEQKLFRTKHRPSGLEKMDLYLSPPVPVFGALAFLFVTLRARRSLRKLMKKGGVARLHVENLVAFLPLLGVGAPRHGSMVLDYHGLVPEEVRERGGWLAGSIFPFLLKRLEKHALANCQGVVCASHPFKEYLSTECAVPGDRILVDQNSIESSFAPRPESRNYYRKLYGFEDKFVIVYAGNLMPHQCPDVIAGFFKAIRQKLPHVRLVIFTHDQAGLKRFLLRHGPFHGEVTYMRLEHDDMPHYLSLGDLGLLLREENPATRVSSPAKFPEYLACGLPVVISSGVGSASEVVERMGLGVVVNTKDIAGGAEKVIEFIMASRPVVGELREKCRKAAFDLFTVREENEIEKFYRSLEASGGE
jgi:glycosyltransferase involved in cell wall biosynthesis